MDDARQLRRLTTSTEPIGGKVVRLPVHAELVSRLRDMIVEGEFPPGLRLSERLLCAQLGTTRSPLREALKAVAAEGFLELMPNRGARVVVLTARQIKDIFDVVVMLEIGAADIACRNADAAVIAQIGELHFRMERHLLTGAYRDFFKVNLAIHQHIVDAAGNATLSDTYAKLNARIRRFRFFLHQSPTTCEPDMRLLESSFQTAMGEHEDIFSALRARDGARLTAAIAHHYKNEAVAARLEAVETTEHDDAPS
jgi:DNA-binding GntR family transcriptional regulator